MRIALCGIHEEVNTFAVETMGLATVTGNMATGFQRFEGQATIDAYKGTQSWPGGWVDAFLEEPEVEFIPVAFYNYTAGAMIQGEAYQEMKQDILDSLKAALPLDAVALAFAKVAPSMSGMFRSESTSSNGLSSRSA